MPSGAVTASSAVVFGPADAALLGFAVAAVAVSLAAVSGAVEAVCTAVSCACPGWQPNINDASSAPSFRMGRTLPNLGA